jgi:hypothetical protein
MLAGSRFGHWLESGRDVAGCHRGPRGGNNDDRSRDQLRGRKKRVGRWRRGGALI